MRTEKKIFSISRQLYDAKEGFIKKINRIPIFNYSKIATTLLMSTKSLEIKFRKKFLNTETLIQLESILSWAAIHIEVQSLLITSFGEDFVQGFDPAEIKLLSEEKLKEDFSRIATIAQTLINLPQTVVIDLKKGTRGVGLEWALASDIRIAKSDALFCFDHLFCGLTPMCGMFSFLRPYLNQNVLRSLLLSGSEFNKESLLALGGYCEFDQDPSVILSNIFSQAPVARMQAKRGLHGSIHSLSKEDLAIEKQLFNAALHSLDYTRVSDFMNPIEFKEKITDIKN